MTIRFHGIERCELRVDSFSGLQYVTGSDIENVSERPSRAFVVNRHECAGRQLFFLCRRAPATATAGLTLEKVEADAP